MRIRPARTADAIGELLGQLGYPQDSPAVRIQTWLDDPACAVYVADDGEVQGVIAVQLCRFFERDGVWARITALVVSDRVRGRGVGSQLIAAAESFAADHGCVRMEVTSADRRDDAHKFYRGRGYTDQTGKSSRFLRDLPASAPAREGSDNPSCWGLSVGIRAQNPQHEWISDPRPDL
jgi:GNAT superfamily N-acetyltransferase